MTTRIRKLDPADHRGRILHDWIGRTYARWTQSREMKRTVRALHKLPDFALRDIGIHRSEINGVATFRRLNGRA